MTVRDVVTVLQRAEMVRRIAEEIEGYVVELGHDGRLVELQLEELTGGVRADLRLVGKDYFVESPEWMLAQVTARLAHISDDELLDLRVVASVLHLPTELDLDSSLQPRGYRLLSKIPRLPEVIAGHVIERFGTLPKVMRASLADLVEVEGVGEARARAIKDGLSRVAETSILDRYVVTSRLGSLASSARSCLPPACQRLREGPVHDVSAEARPLLVDGLEVPAFHARPDGMPTAGVVLHPDIGGLRPLFEDMARRLATHGLAVCVVEPWASLPESSQWTTAEQRLAHVKDLDDGQQMDMLERGRRPPRRRGRRLAGVRARLLHGRPLRAEGRVDRPLRRRGRFLRDDPHARGVAGTGSPDRTARRRGAHGADAGVLRLRRSVDAGRRHRRAARRVERPHRLRDRRGGRRRPRLRPRPRARRAPRRRCRARLGPRVAVGRRELKQRAGEQSDGRASATRRSQARSQSRAQRAAQEHAT